MDQYPDHTGAKMSVTSRYPVAPLIQSQEVTWIEGHPLWVTEEENDSLSQQNKCF